MTKICWRSVDTQFHDGAGSILLSLLPIKAANTLFMTICTLLPPRWLMIHDQEWLMLCWCWFSWRGMERFTLSFAYKGSKYFVFDNLQPIAYNITQDRWPRIFDAPLTLNLSQVYPQYVIIWFGVVHHSPWFGSLSSVFVYFLLDHYIVL